MMLIQLSPHSIPNPLKLLFDFKKTHFFLEVRGVV